MKGKDEGVKEIRFNEVGSKRMRIKNRGMCGKCQRMYQSSTQS